jgi:uncharacterized membrane protein YagU involved in acid resistance
MRWKRRPNVWKGAAAGLLGGLIASCVMEVFQAAVANLPGQPEEQAESNDEAATVKAAVAVSTKLLHRPVRQEQKQKAGELVHYMDGTAMGGLYGALAEEWPPAAAGMGAAFGAALWAVSDEVAVPVARLAKPPLRYPLATHVKALASHIVYGVSAELLRRALR